MSKTKKPSRASRSAAPRGWAFDVASKIADDIFALGDEPNSPTQRIQFMGGVWTPDKSQERGQGGLGKTGLIAFLERKLQEHMPNAGDHRPEGARK